MSDSMSDSEAKILRDGMLLSEKTSGIPRKGTYEFHHYMMEFKQQISMFADWGGVDPTNPAGMVGFSRRCLPLVRVVNMRLMRELRASDTSIQAIWTRLASLRWPERTSDWGDMLSWLDHQDVVTLASDPRFDISFDMVSGSGAEMAAERAAMVSSRGDETVRRAEEKRKSLLREVAAATASLSESRVEQSARPADSAVQRRMGDEIARLDGLMAELAELDEKSAPEGAGMGSTLGGSISLFEEKPCISVPKATAGWQAILALVRAGKDIRGYVQNVRMRILTPGGVGMASQLVPLGRVLSSLRWTKCPIPMVDFGAPWPGHFLEEVQRVIVPLSIQRMAQMRSELEGIKKMPSQPFDEFAVVLANKFEEYTRATRVVVDDNQRVNLLIGAVCEGDTCCLMLHTQYSHLVAQACDTGLTNAQVSYDVLVQRTSAALANMPRATAATVTAAVAAVRCGFCGRTNHATEQCFRREAAVRPSVAKGDRAKNRGSGQRRGVCFHCQKAGHFRSECPLWQASGGNKSSGADKAPSGRFGGTCHRCQKQGHRAAECLAEKPVPIGKASAGSAQVAREPPVGAANQNVDDQQVDPVCFRDAASEAGCCVMRATPLISRTPSVTECGQTSAASVGAGRVQGSEQKQGLRAACSPAVDTKIGQRAVLADGEGLKPIYIDSGADAHLWADRRHIKNLRAGPPIVVSGYDGQGSRRLTTVGDVELRTSIGKAQGAGQYHSLLLTAYYCPTAQISLLSVACIVRDDPKLSVSFDKAGVKVLWSEDQHTKPVCLLRGSMVSHHYEVQPVAAPPANSVDRSAAASHAATTRVTVAAMRSGSLAEEAARARRERQTRAGTARVAGPPAGGSQGAVSSTVGATVPAVAVPLAPSGAVVLPQEQQGRAATQQGLSYAAAVGRVRSIPKAAKARGPKLTATAAKPKPQKPRGQQAPVPGGQVPVVELPQHPRTVMGRQQRPHPVAATRAATQPVVVTTGVASSRPVTQPVQGAPAGAPVTERAPAGATSVQGVPGPELQRAPSAVPAPAAEQQQQQRRRRRPLRRRGPFRTASEERHVQEYLYARRHQEADTVPAPPTGVAASAVAVPTEPVGAGQDRPVFQAQQRPKRQRSQGRQGRRGPQESLPDIQLPHWVTMPNVVSGVGAAASQAASGTQTAGVPEPLSSGQQAGQVAPTMDAPAAFPPLRPRAEATITERRRQEMTRQHPDWPLEEAKLPERYRWSENILGTERPIVPGYRRPHLLHDEHNQVRLAHLTSIWRVLAEATASQAWNPEWDQLMTTAFNELYHRTWMYPEAPGEIDPGVYTYPAFQDVATGGPGWQAHALSMLLCSDQAIRMLQHQLGAVRYRLTQGELPWRGADPAIGRGPQGPVWYRLKLHQRPPVDATSSPEAEMAGRGERRPREDRDFIDFSLREQEPPEKQARTGETQAASVRTVSLHAAGPAAPAIPVVQLEQQPRVVRPVPTARVVVTRPRRQVVDEVPKPAEDKPEGPNPRCWHCGEMRLDNPHHDVEHSRCRFKRYTLSMWNQGVPIPWVSSDTQEVRDRVTIYLTGRFARKQARNRVERSRRRQRERQAPAAQAVPSSLPPQVPPQVAPAAVPECQPSGAEQVAQADDLSSEEEAEASEMENGELAPSVSDTEEEQAPQGDVESPEKCPRFRESPEPEEEEEEAASDAEMTPVVAAAVTSSTTATGSSSSGTASTGSSLARAISTALQDLSALTAVEASAAASVGSLTTSAGSITITVPVMDSSSGSDRCDDSVVEQPEYHTGGRAPWRTLSWVSLIANPRRRVWGRAPRSRSELRPVAQKEETSAHTPTRVFVHPAAIAAARQSRQRTTVVEEREQMSQTCRCF